MVESPLLPIVGQAPDPFGQNVVVGGDRPAVAVAPKIFARIETVTGEIAERPHLLALHFGERRLGDVLDDANPARPADRRDPVHRRGMSEHVDRKHRLGPGRKRALQFVRIHLSGRGVDVHEHQPRADVRYGISGGNPGIRNRDRLVARTEIEGADREVERIRARSDADRVPRPDGGGELPLEGGHGRPADEGRISDHIGHGAIDFGPQGIVLGREIDEGNHDSFRRSHSGQSR